MKMAKGNRPLDRTFYFKPIDAIKFCQPEYKGLIKRHTPNDQDIIQYAKTEKKNPNSHYTDNFSGKIKVKKVNPKTRKVHRKPNEVEISKRNYKPKPRRMNKPVQVDKNLKYTHYALNGIKKGENNDSLKRKLQKQGLNPVDLVVYKDPITHFNKGNGIMALNTNDFNLRDRQIKHLGKIGISTTQVKNHNRKMI